jgi:5-methylcytosine-specific restriction enzyme subunit McrC
VKIIELTEYKPQLFPRDEIPEPVVEDLQQKYSSQVDLALKYSKTGDRWQITSQGWVGHIPLTPDFHLALRPKVPLQNIFGMLEYAYNLNSFRFLEGLIDCQSLEEFYNHLAYVLAQRILDRCRQGLYRAYLPKTQQLGYVRGRLDVRQAIQKPWDVKLKCQYEEHTADIEENQILAWTLFIIGRSSLCAERVLPKVRQAYHALQGSVTLKSCTADDCIGRKYNRLNEDYRPLHSLCRFFLENTGSSHERGENTMLPFLVDMARLYELFVAEWLKAHLPQDLILKFQERVNIGKTLHFKTDLVLYDVLIGTPRYILDTKYKTPRVPASEDVCQVVTYGVSKSCQKVVLVYPTSLTYALDEWVGNIRFRSLTFSLDGDLDLAGKAFLDALLIGTSMRANAG